jgi:hypothetical protein
MSSYPQEHRDKAEEAWYQQKRKPLTPEEMATYEREYVYGSHLQPGLERSPTYLTPRERQVQEGKGQQLYEQSLAQRSGVLVGAEERSIAEQQYQERLAGIQARGVQGPVSFEEMSQRLIGIHEGLVIQEYHQKGYELVGRTETELLFQPIDKKVFVSTSLFGPKMLWVSETTADHSYTQSQTRAGIRS